MPSSPISTWLSSYKQSSICGIKEFNELRSKRISSNPIAGDTRQNHACRIKGCIVWRQLHHQPMHRVEATAPGSRHVLQVVGRNQSLPRLSKGEAALQQQGGNPVDRCCRTALRLFQDGIYLFDSSTPPTTAAAPSPLIFGETSFIILSFLVVIFVSLLLSLVAFIPRCNPA